MKKKFYILIFLFLGIFALQAQCPKFFNGLGVASSNPYWTGCSGGPLTIFVQPNINIGAYTIIWGDGTANSSGASLNTSASISHTYATTVDTFLVTITTVSPACTIHGVAVLEQTPSASIQIPLGNPVYGCTPATFNFQNASTNISKTTRFTWNFGDGTPTQAYNYTNMGQIMSHTYLPGTTNCNVPITLTAQNYCNAGSPSTNIYSPIQVWDKDNVGITPDAPIKCLPSTTFHFNNTTNLNCKALGNIQQRYEYWNFGDHWGLGHDSIINWQPFSPPNRPGYDLTYPGVGIYSVLLKDSSFCGTAQKTISVEVTIPPVAAFSLSADSICEGQSITATNLSTGSANQFIWNFGDGSASITVGTTVAETKTYPTAGTYTISLIANVMGASGCTSTITKQVVVKPKPIANFSLGANNFCDVGAETFTNTSSGAIASYLWNFGNGNTDTAPNPASQSYTGAGAYNVVLNVTGSNGCTASKTNAVKVFQSPDAQINPFSVCKNVSGTFVNASTSAVGDPITSWLWNFGDGSATSAVQNPSHTFSNSGTYTVKLTAFTAFCSNKDSVSAVINPPPVSHYVQSTSAGCTALTVSFTNQSTGAATYTWNFGDGTAVNTTVNPIHVFANNGTRDTTYHTSLIAVSSFGCKDTFNNNVTVFHAAHAAFTSDYIINCSPVPVHFTNTSIGALSYFWNFGDGSAVDTAKNPSHVFLNNSSFLQTFTTTLTISSSNGCTNSVTQDISLYPKPNFSFTALPVDTGCADLSVSFSASSGGALYQWSFGDGAVSTMQSPNHTFINNTNHDSISHVELITTTPFSCKDTDYVTVLIHPLPTAGFNSTIRLGCSPLTVSFTDNSVLASTYLWDFGDGNSSTIASPTHTFVNTTNAVKIYSVVFQIKTVYGCIDTVIRPVEVYPKVTATFVSPLNACSPLSVAMINNSVNATIYNWDFGDGTLSTQITPSHIFINPTFANKNDTITLIAQSALGCTDTAKAPIIVFYKPHADFNLSTNAGCQPLLVNFTNTSVGATSNSWTFGDGSPLNSAVDVSYTYLNITGNTIAENAQLIVTTANSCHDTIAKIINVYPKVTASFTGFASGCSPLAVSLLNHSVNANSYNWSFGDGTFSLQTDVTHTFINNSGIAVNDTIRLIASSALGCVDTQKTIVTVKFKPHAAFTLNANTGCSPFVEVFTNQSLNALHYQWSLGDGSPLDTLSSPLHTYLNNGGITITDNIRLIVTSTDNCKDTALNSIDIYPKVTASFTGFASGCSPLAVSLLNHSVNANSYTWDLGDGALSAQTDVMHTFVNNSGIAVNDTIRLIASSALGCVDTQKTVVNVKFKPQAAFSLNANTGCSPLLEVFTNQSVNALHYQWNYGDGSPFDTIPSPLHTYINNGGLSITDNIVLIVTSVAGCKDTTANSVVVYPKVTASFNGVTSGCSPVAVSLLNHSVNANSYNWDLGDGTLSAQAAVTHTYINNSAAAVYDTIKLIASSSLGCVDTQTAVVNVKFKPQASFILNANAGCSPLVEMFTNQSVNALHYQWNYGDGSAFDTIQSPLHTYINNGGLSIADNIVLIVSSSAGCKDTATNSINVYPKVTASFNGFSSGCSPLTVSLLNHSVNANSYNWDLGDGALSVQTAVTHTYINNSTAAVNDTIKLIASSFLGCADTQKTVVNVKFKPHAAFSLSTNAGCSPLKAVFTNQSANAIHYQWDFGDASLFDTIVSPSHSYINSGSVSITNNIMLIVSSTGGCKDTSANSITIYPKVIAAFTCPAIGCSPYTANFVNHSINSSIYLWDFGNGNMSGQPNPSNTYINSAIDNQVDTVRLIASSNLGCSDTTKTTTIVAHQPIANFSASPTSQLYPLATVSVINSSNAGTWNFSWAWGDANSSILQNPSPNTYSTWGTYDIRLIVNSADCADTVFHTITIVPPLPIASFTIPDNSGCEPDKICFTNTSQYAVISAWDFGDGNSSNATNPCYTYFSAGTYDVKLRVTGPGGQTDEADTTVYIYPKPIANFLATPLLVEVPNTPAQFLNLSLDADTYLWDFGNGVTSIEENPKYSYTLPGEYDIKLVASNQYGCIDSITKLKYIRAQLISDIAFPNAFTPNSSSSSGGTYDPSSYSNDVFFPFTVNGVDEYHLLIYNRWGELLFASNDIKIGWDGYYHGVLSKQDVYVWKVEGKYIDGSSYKKTGDVTLLVR
jgi:PKD repeat protein